MTRVQSILFNLIFLPLCLYGQGTGNNYVVSSVLASGKWYKIAVIESGIYRIDYSTLEQLGLDNPSFPRIFGNNPGQLSFFNDNTAPDDLKEVAVSLHKGNDGIFNEGDFLLFFGENAHKWIYDETSGDFNFLRHNYSDTAFYFITSGSTPGKSVMIAEKPSSQANYFSAESDALFIYETETANLLKSGREWYQPVSAAGSPEIDPGFKGINTSVPVRFSARLLARSPVPTLFRFYENGSPIQSTSVAGVDVNSTTGTYASVSESSWESVPQSSSPVYGLKYFNNGETSSGGWVDYVKLHARKKNLFNGETSFYTDINSVGSGNVTRFSVETTVDNTVIWDITDPYNPKEEEVEKSGNTISFSSVTDSLKRFVAFATGKSKSPFFTKKPVVNQDLHASLPAEMIIVTHPLFKDHATKLAEIHKKNSGLISFVVTPEMIYNEFSGGIPDIVAIRNFLRMKFLKQRNTDSPLKYLLLFGDGSYDNKSTAPGNTDFIPTYQSVNSNVFISSFTSDDFYGLLEDGEGEDLGTLDLGIGRIPVSDTSQAGIVVSKIRNYLDSSNRGDWKNIVCLIADDEDGNTHLTDAESLAKILSDSAAWVNTAKIYFDSFKQTTTPTGQYYPDVTQAINERVNSGALVVNYTGHGNENSLAHERVVTSDAISKWKNISRLPLFITATCEFSRFDNIDINPVSGTITGITSAGEKILLSKNGGGIALMSTTRLAYSAPNLDLNRHIFNFAFKPDSSGKAGRLGDIIRYAKNNSANNINRRNFVLLGDPAVRLGYPWHGKIITDSVNNLPVVEGHDTLKALSTIRISGHAEDAGGRLITDFNGIVSPIVFEKPVTRITLANDGGEKAEFSTRDNVLFSGKTDSRNGKFSFTFIVPRDIDYNFGKGKISYYASDESIDLTGVCNEIIIGGFDNNARSDTSGPVIKLYLNDTLFRNDGLSGPDPKLFALINDPDGINTTGTGIGHDLICWLDNDREKSYILNNYFVNDPGIFGKGSLIFQLTGLERGNHSITLKAWDNFNNSSELTLHFFVEDGERFVLRNLINYPNPFTGATSISAEHNRPGEELSVSVTIFDISGRLIRMIRESSVPEGFQISPLRWDGCDKYGKRAGKGIYPYRVSATTDSGETAIISGRMIIL